MKRTLAVWLSVAALAAAGSRTARAADPAPPAPEPAGISTGHYAAAGVVGTLLGYGIGHAIAGEWSDFGWIFTAGELTPLIVGGATLSFQRLENEDDTDDTVPIVLLVSYGIFRVVEIVDIWTRPVVRSDAAALPPRGGWAALPVPGRHGARVVIAGSF